MMPHDLHLNLWQRAIVAAIKTFYGIFTLVLFLAYMLIQGALFFAPTAQYKKELAAAQQRLWSLRNAPTGLKHRFHTLKSGLRLHYVTTEPVSASAQNLVVFVHGFPDSWALYKSYLLSSKLRENAVLVAVDLPGYGGSGEIPVCDSNGILEAITEFVLAMKEQYIHSRAASFQEPGRTILVAHDWGGIIAFRLAAEAHQIADRFILAACIHPPLLVSNVYTRSNTIFAMLRQWRRNPRSIGLLTKSVKTALPMLIQFNKSQYIFTFQLPAPIARFWGPLGNYWLFRVCHWMTTKSRVPNAEMMASCLGPSLEECDAPKSLKNQSTSKIVEKYDETESYPVDVALRAAKGGWAAKIQYYRDNLLLKPWDKSMEILWALSQEDQTALSTRRKSSVNGTLFESGPKGALKAPATILFGANDPAFEARIAVEGVEDYLTRGSQVLVLGQTGHWIPLERNGKIVLEDVVKWAVDGEKQKLKDVVTADPSLSVKIIAER